jgi:hypothetical protein
MANDVTSYTAAGFNPIPIIPNGTKCPAVEWKPYQTQRATPAELKKWFGKRKHGIGIVCGPISGNLLVIDFDKQAEHIYPQWLEQVRQQLPELANRLAVVQTPRPGYHVWLKTTETDPPGPQTLAYSAPKPTADASSSPILDADGQPIQEPGILIEIRGTGNYVIAPGSPDATHYTRKPYTWFQGGPAEVPEVTDRELTILLDAARALTQYSPQHVQRKAGKRYEGEPRPGDVFNQHADLLKLLLSHGWQEHHRVGETLHLTRPGKTKTDGTSATLGALRSVDGRPLLYVFSSAASPFQANQTYDAFAAYTLLEHGGNYGRAASTVRAKYAQQVQEAQKLWQDAHQPQKLEYEPFPVDLFPSPVREYVTEQAKAIGIDAAFVAVPMLPVLAGLIGQTRKIRIKEEWTEPSILFTAVVNSSGGGKSPGFKAAMKLPMHIESKLQRIRARKQAEYQAERKQWKAKNDKKLREPEPEPYNTQLIVDDATMEAITSIHCHNPRGLLLATDELSGWLGSFNVYRKGQGRDVQNWLTFYDGGPVAVNRKNGERLFLLSTSISVAGGIQPKVAKEKLYTEEFITNGLVGRFLVASPPFAVADFSESVVPKEVSQDAMALATKLYNLTGCIVDIEGQPCAESTLLGFTPEAHNRWVTYMETTKAQAEQMVDPQRTLFVKLRPAAARIALVLSVVEQVWKGTDATGPIELRSLEAGIQIAEWFGREVERNWTSKRGAGLLEHLGWIQEKHPNGIDARELQQGRKGIEKADDARRVLQKLVEQGYGRWEGILFVPH